MELRLKKMRALRSIVCKRMDLYQRKTITSEPLPVAYSSNFSSVADIICFNPTNNKVNTLIKLCEKSHQKDAYHQFSKFIADNNFGVEEGFIYNYETREWLRIWRGVKTGDTRSRELNLEMSEQV